MSADIVIMQFLSRQPYWQVNSQHVCISHVMSVGHQQAIGPLVPAIFLPPLPYCSLSVRHTVHLSDVSVGLRNFTVTYSLHLQPGMNLCKSLCEEV